MSAETPKPAAEATRVSQPINERVGPRFGGGGAGIPVEKSKDFTGSMSRLFSEMGPDRPRMFLVLGLALTSVSLAVVGPRILGHATDVIIKGLRHKNAGGAGGTR